MYPIEVTLFITNFRKAVTLLATDCVGLGNVYLFFGFCLLYMTIVLQSYNALNGHRQYLF